MNDFELYSDGGPMTTLFRLTPLSDRAIAWVEENVSTEGFQPAWPVLYVEHGYVDHLLAGIEAAGMTVDGSVSGAVVALGRGV